MRRKLGILAGWLTIACASGVWAQNASFAVPKRVTAGQAFSVSTSGSGQATLYITGPSQTLARKVRLGQNIYFANGTLTSAGFYLAVLTQDASSKSSGFYVAPAAEPAHVSFLARPSRLPVNLHNAITGTAYVYDAYHNLITAPNRVTFDLSTPSGATQSASVETRDGAAWTALNSTPQEGIDQFTVRIANISSKRIVQQVPGTACNLTISAQPLPDGRLMVKTNSVRDCSGNPMPDGTIVTFTESYGGEQSIADVPLKKGVAQVELPARSGAVLSAASGVALGNEIRWGH